MTRRKCVERCAVCGREKDRVLCAPKLLRICEERVVLYNTYDDAAIAPRANTLSENSPIRKRV